MVKKSLWKIQQEKTWLEIPQGMIVRSLKKICISNAINVTVDNAICEKDSLIL